MIFIKLVQIKDVYLKKSFEKIELGDEFSRPAKNKLTKTYAKRCPRTSKT